MDATFGLILMTLTVLIVYGGVRREVVRCLNSLDLEGRDIEQA